MEESLFEWSEGADTATSAGEDLPGADMPLAARLRPRSLSEYIGQEHLLGAGCLLRRAIESDRFSSIILYGPPGTGKTSLSEIIANLSGSVFVRLSGVTSSVADIRREIAAAVARRRAGGRKTILFVDEIHRFSRSQQDSLLPDVENGNVRLVGATTFNPQFHVVSALLSRSLVFELRPLAESEVRRLIANALADERGFAGRKIELAEDAASFLASVCEGDARRTLNALEIAVLTTPADPDGVVRVGLPAVEASVQRKMVSYGDDGHYDTASAFIKSMRGSDPDAALYYLALMLQAGEDIRFIARRIVIFASEDVGNADPRALSVAVDAMRAVEMIGLPEARIILGQAVTYCATAPKSNASFYTYIYSAEDVAKKRVLPVPFALRDAHYKGAAALGHGAGYVNPHSTGGFAVQEYLSVEKRYYEPLEIGYESKIKERIDYWRSLRQYGKEAAANG